MDIIWIIHNDEFIYGFDMKLLQRRVIFFLLSFINDVFIWSSASSARASAFRPGSRLLPAPRRIRTAVTDFRFQYSGNGPGATHRLPDSVPRGGCSR